jgi:HK97 gp10 family phage protein
MAVSVFGRDFVVKQLTQLFPREMNATMRRTTLALAKEARDKIRNRAPRRTGTLKKAIKHMRSRGRPGLVEAKVIVTKGSTERFDGFYWFFIEFGTVKKAARPFIAPVVKEMKPGYIPRLRKEVQKQVFKQLEKRAAKQRKGTK